MVWYMKSCDFVDVVLKMLPGNLSEFSCLCNVAWLDFLWETEQGEKEVIPAANYLHAPGFSFSATSAPSRLHPDTMSIHLS